MASSLQISNIENWAVEDRVRTLARAFNVLQLMDPPSWGEAGKPILRIASQNGIALNLDPSHLIKEAQEFICDKPTLFDAGTIACLAQQSHPRLLACLAIVELAYLAQHRKLLIDNEDSRFAIRLGLGLEHVRRGNTDHFLATFFELSQSPIRHIALSLLIDKHEHITEFIKKQDYLSVLNHAAWAGFEYRPDIHKPENYRCLTTLSESQWEIIERLGAPSWLDPRLEPHERNSAGTPVREIYEQKAVFRKSDLLPTDRIHWSFGKRLTRNIVAVKAEGPSGKSELYVEQLKFMRGYSKRLYKRYSTIITQDNGDVHIATTDLNAEPAFYQEPARDRDLLTALTSPRRAMEIVSIPQMGRFPAIIHGRPNSPFDEVIEDDGERPFGSIEEILAKKLVAITEARTAAQAELEHIAINIIGLPMHHNLVVAESGHGCQSILNVLRIACRMHRKGITICSSTGLGGHFQFNSNPNQCVSIEGRTRLAPVFPHLGSGVLALRNIPDYQSGLEKFALCAGIAGLHARASAALSWLHLIEWESDHPFVQRLLDNWQNNRQQPRSLDISCARVFLPRADIHTVQALPISTRTIQTRMAIVIIEKHKARIQNLAQRAAILALRATSKR